MILCKFHRQISHGTVAFESGVAEWGLAFTSWRLAIWRVGNWAKAEMKRPKDL